MWTLLNMCDQPLNHENILYRYAKTMGEAPLLLLTIFGNSFSYQEINSFSLGKWTDYKVELCGMTKIGFSRNWRLLFPFKFQLDSRVHTSYMAPFHPFFKFPPSMRTKSDLEPTQLDEGGAYDIKGDVQSNFCFVGFKVHSLHGVWKSQKKSHSTLQATFSFWVEKSSLKMPKMVNFGE